MEYTLNLSSVDDYRMFVKAKTIPRFRLEGRRFFVPDEYAGMLGLDRQNGKSATEYNASYFLFDYQAGISALAIDKQKFAVFADCGLGKTLIIAEFARHARRATNGRILIVSPLMVIEQTVAEMERWYGESPQIVRANKLQDWLDGNGAEIAITNYEAIRPELRQGNLDGLILDESSMLKSHYGKWGTKLIELGRGLDWKLCATGTPAPNDRIEYANHAVFLDRFQTVNAFLATYFVNRGQTDNRWELKPHALRPFYTQLADFAIFLTDPSVYGWSSNTEPLPPINVDIRDVPLTKEQERLAYGMTGELFANKVGGIANRAQLSAIAKGWHKCEAVETRKPEFVRHAADNAKGQSIVWCEYNREQEMLESVFGDDAASITGATPHEQRVDLLAAFKSGEVRTLISKPKILGFGLNLQHATTQVFSTLQDSYEKYYQAIKRSNRYGSTEPLDVVIPITDIERPMVDTVLRKADMVDQDAKVQERLFREVQKGLGSGSI